MPFDATVLIIGTLDTKADETNYLAEVIRQMGVKTILMDVNIGGEPAISHNPENDRPLVEELRRCLTSPQVELVELDMELNSEEFARIALERFEAMMKIGPSSE